MRMKRDFTYHGREYYMNSNRNGVSRDNYEFFPKWKLLEYREDCWMEIACVDTKKEAIEVIKQREKCGL